MTRKKANPADAADFADDDSLPPGEIIDQAGADLAEMRQEIRRAVTMELGEARSQHETLLGEAQDAAGQIVADAKAARDRLVHEIDVAVKVELSRAMTDAEEAGVSLSPPSAVVADYVLAHPVQGEAARLPAPLMGANAPYDATDGRALHALSCPPFCPPPPPGAPYPTGTGGIPVQPGPYNLWVGQRPAGQTCYCLPASMGPFDPGDSNPAQYPSAAECQANLINWCPPGQSPAAPGTPGTPVAVPPPYPPGSFPQPPALPPVPAPPVAPPAGGAPGAPIPAPGGGIINCPQLPPGWFWGNPYDPLQPPYPPPGTIIVPIIGPGGYPFPVILPGPSYPFPVPGPPIQPTPPVGPPIVSVPIPPVGPPIVSVPIPPGPPGTSPGTVCPPPPVIPPCPPIPPPAPCCPADWQWLTGRVHGQDWIATARAWWGPAGDKVAGPPTLEKVVQDSTEDFASVNVSIDRFALILEELGTAGGGVPTIP